MRVCRAESGGRNNAAPAGVIVLGAAVAADGRDHPLRVHPGSQRGDDVGIDATQPDEGLSTGAVVDGKIQRQGMLDVTDIAGVVEHGQRGQRAECSAGELRGERRGRGQCDQLLDGSVIHRGETVEADVGDRRTIGTIDRAVVDNDGPATRIGRRGRAGEIRPVHHLGRRRCSGADDGQSHRQQAWHPIARLSGRPPTPRPTWPERRTGHSCGLLRHAADCPSRQR